MQQAKLQTTTVSDQWASFKHLKHIKIGLEPIEMLNLGTYQCLIA